MQKTTLSKRCKRKNSRKNIHHLLKRELPRHSKLLGLYSKLDSEGIFRSGGQLIYAESLPRDVWYPIIVP